VIFSLTAACLLPGAGVMDFTRFKELLMQYGYSGSLIIEVYRSNF
jgi:sugar phosphate isomerase/epimerase